MEPERDFCHGLLIASMPAATFGNMPLHVRCGAATVGGCCCCFCGSCGCCCGERACGLRRLVEPPALAAVCPVCCGFEVSGAGRPMEGGPGGSGRGVANEVSACSAIRSGTTR